MGLGNDVIAYSRWFETPLGSRVWEDERAIVLPLLRPVAGRRVLDAGVGDGRLALDLASQGALVAGVDLALPMLRLAAARAAKTSATLPLAAGRVEALPFDLGSFDVVVALTVLCFVQEPSAAVREMARVTRAGGRVVLADLDRWSLWAAMRRVRGMLGVRGWRGARFWSRAGLERLLSSAGLEPRGWGSAVFYPRSARLASLLRPIEATLRGRTTLGAAFIAVAGAKPGAGD